MMNKIKQILAVLVLAGASVNGQTITETFGTGANAFSIDFVTIGNPGNAAQSGWGYSLGSVGYTFNLGKYEISRDQVLKANSAGGLGITLGNMSLYGGNGANRPASGVSWYEAAQFVNYLNTSQGFTPAYKFNGGAFRLWNSSDVGYDPNNRFRNTQAKYVLPSRDEWHKGAYGSPSGAWFQYPTGSNEPPTPEQDTTTGAVYNTSGNPGTGPSDVTLAGSLSAWGTMAQGGNVREWRETAFDGVNDSAGEYVSWSGGSWMEGAEGLVAFYASWPVGINEWPESGNIAHGFRVASVPEPSSLSLLLAGGAVLMAGRRRNRGQ